MGCGPNFCNMVRTLLGNANARVCVNGDLTQAFNLTRSIRKGCPLVPLLYAIEVMNGLN